MPQAEAESTTSRRSFLRLLGRSAAAATVVTAPVAMAAPAFITPAEYIAELEAVGRAARAFTYCGKPCAGYAEYVGAYYDNYSEERDERYHALLLRVRKAFRANSKWHDEVAAYLQSIGRYQPI